MDFASKFCSWVWTMVRLNAARDIGRDFDPAEFAVELDAHAWKLLGDHQCQPALPELPTAYYPENVKTVLLRSGVYAL